MSMEFLVKLRDGSQKMAEGAQLVADAAAEYLEKLAPSPSEGDKEPDYSKLSWEQKQGEKGLFERTSERTNQNSDLWKHLTAKLKEHAGFWQHHGYKYWFDMQNEAVIARRKIA